MSNLRCLNCGTDNNFQVGELKAEIPVKGESYSNFRSITTEENPYMTIYAHECRNCGFIMLFSKNKSK